MIRSTRFGILTLTNFKIQNVGLNASRKRFKFNLGLFSAQRLIIMFHGKIIQVVLFMITPSIKLKITHHAHNFENVKKN